MQFLSVWIVLAVARVPVSLQTCEAGSMSAISRPQSGRAGRRSPGPAALVLAESADAFQVAGLRSLGPRRLVRKRAAVRGVATGALRLYLAETQEDLEKVAKLQLDAFAPEAEAPSRFAFFTPRDSREARARRLADELATRRKGGSDLWAVKQSAEELLATADLSAQELLLPSHSLGGDGSLYLSSMIVVEAVRRQGVATTLLAAVEDRARHREAPGIWLHVEPFNTAAIGLYTNAGYTRQPDNRQNTGFTDALWPNRSPRPVLFYKSLEPN